MTLAIELIRQTPLDAIKYLDILTLAECWTRRDDSYSKDWNFDNVASQKDEPYLNCEKSRTDGDKEAANWIFQGNPSPHSKSPNIKSNKNNYSKHFVKNVESLNNLQPFTQCPNSPEQVVETLLKKCQNVETYVPVKEKLFLFESLCKMGRKVRSSEDVSLKFEKSTTKRTKSCYDLTNINTQIAVREICKYFENRETRQKVVHNYLSKY